VTVRDSLIERWLQANRAHAAGSLNFGPRSSEKAPDLQALAQRELSIPGRYQIGNVPPAPASQPWWERAWLWVADRWEQMWKALFSHAHVGKAQAASIGDVLLVIVGVILIYCVVRIMHNVQVRRCAPRLESAPLEEGPSPRALYRSACNAASRGDYGTAALLLFAATVALLGRQGAVEITSTATVGDLRRELRVDNAALIPRFDAVAAPFVQRAYADRAVDEPQWQHARTAFESLSQG
jgi:hypothetical protein